MDRIRYKCVIGVLIALLAPSVALAQTETVEYYASDAIGSVRVVFNASGAVIGRMDYAPFGQELYNGLLMPNERFALLSRDTEAGLDYAQARMYQSRTGRFNAPDSVYDGLLNPQNWNRYQYALNDPIALGDPDGLTPRKIVVSRDDWGKIEGFFGDYVGAAGGPWPYSEIVRLDGEWERQQKRRGGGSRRNPGNSGGQTGGNSGDNGENQGGPKPNPNSCHAFVDNVASFVSTNTGGLLSRANRMPFKGLAMANMVVKKAVLGTRIPLRAPGVSGFRPELVDFRQNEDVYKHVLFPAGAMFLPNGFSSVGAVTAYDAVESLFKDQSRMELNGDIAGIKVGMAISEWVWNGDAFALKRSMREILCVQ
jgi:RHS repeat-associated protein